MVEKAKKIWMDGELVNWDDANVHVLTHTLHYGLGIFEGIRCYECSDGRSEIFRLEEHTERLFDSAKIAQMNIPYSHDEINKAIIDTIKVNELKSCYIRPLIFVGDGPMGLYVEEYPIRSIIAVWPWGAYLGEDGLKNGIKAKVSSYTRHHINVTMTKAKVSGHYVNSMLAKKEVKSAGYDEAIMLDPDGYVAEASGANIFAVRKGTIITPQVTTVLEGITRDSVIKIARDKGYSVKEDRLSRDELYISDEVFLTGSAAELTPIREIDDRIIGTGKPGSITKDIQDTFFEIVKGDDKKYESWLTYI
ncbi:branched-chain amino acid transaminase [Thermodesulfobacteriota bacterium]